MSIETFKVRAFYGNIYNSGQFRSQSTHMLCNAKAAWDSFPVQVHER